MSQSESDEISDRQLLSTVIRNHSWLMSILRTVSSVSDAECYVGAGAIRDSVWDYMSGRRGSTQVKDDSEFARRLLEDPAGNALLDAVFGNSPFLSQSMSSEFAFAREVLEQGPDAAFARVLAELAQTRQHQTELTGVMREMRIAKRRCSLVVGLADIAGAWRLDRVCGALSEFADATLSVAAAHLLTSAAAAGEFTSDDTAEKAASRLGGPLPSAGGRPSAVAVGGKRAFGSVEHGATAAIASAIEAASFGPRRLEVTHRDRGRLQ